MTLPIALLALVVSLLTAGYVVIGGQLPLDGALKQPTKTQAVSDAPDTSRQANKAARLGVGGLSARIADLAAEVAPSVVNIDVSRTQRVAPAQHLSPLYGDLFERFFGFDMNVRPTPQQRSYKKQLGNGSGVVIDKDGHILTNYHVIAGADEVMVTFKNTQKYPAKVVGRDRLSDLALLKIEANPNDLTAAPLGNSDTLRPGDWVLAVGSPLGFDHTVTLGIVSALSREIPDINANVNFIQTDAAINPGNSGGPLVNLSGEVIGINTAISGRGQNIGFAIPANSVKTVVEDLKAKGSVTRPWIGISMTELNEGLAKSLGLPSNTKGVVVAQVLPGSPADKAGLEQGDVIQRINGTKVSTAKKIQEIVRQETIGSEFTMQILRGKTLKALTMKSEVLDEAAVMPDRR